MKTLDVGCGKGKDYTWIDISSDDVTGLDPNRRTLAIARERFPERKFVGGRAESMPFPRNSFDRVVSNVAIPYTNIPAALSEIYRVLRPGGTFHASLHSFSFTWREFGAAFPRPIPSLFRLMVMLSGCMFHVSGNVLPLKRRTESFQTERGMRLAMKRAGFTDLRFVRNDTGKRLFVHAFKPH
jgi:ubiquinone/menaquinone biosynthesis C-methylase UbiE